jgi:hypothetical protein
MATALRIDANRNNSLRSTGPKSPDGKNRSSLNALKHGFTGRTVVFTEAELPEYESLCADYRKEFSPKGRLEADLVQELADIRWSLNGIRAREANLMALESVSETLDLDAVDPDINSALAVAHCLQENSKALNTLSIYEQRKLRAFERTLRGLRQLQKERKEASQHDLYSANLFAQAFQKTEENWTPAVDGFDCSLDELAAWVRHTERSLIVSQVARERLKRP